VSAPRGRPLRDRNSRCFAGRSRTLLQIRPKAVLNRLYETFSWAPIRSIQLRDTGNGGRHGGDILIRRLQTMSDESHSRKSTLDVSLAAQPVLVHDLPPHAGDRKDTQSAYDE